MEDKNLFIGNLFEKYPEEIFEGRVATEGCVLSGIYQNPNLFEESNLKSEYFVSKDARFYYKLAKKLYKQGIRQFDRVAIETRLPRDIVEMYKQKGGWESIQRIIELSGEDNHEFYVDQLIRDVRIQGLHDIGVDLNKSVKLKRGEEKKLYQILKTLDAAGVLSYFESRLAELADVADEDILFEGDLTITEDFIKQLDEGQKTGVPYDVTYPVIEGEKPVPCFPKLSNSTLGLTEGYVHAISAFSSVGKSTLLVTIMMALLYHGRKIVVISNEDDESKYIVKFMAWIAERYFHNEISKRGLTRGNFDPSYYGQIKEVVDFYNKHKIGENIKFVYMADSKMDLALRKAKKYILSNGCDVVIYDTFKIGISSFKDARSDLSIMEDLRKLDVLAKKYSVPAIASIQLATHKKGRLFLDSDCLANCKSAVEQLENLIMMRNVYREELDPTSKYYCSPYKLVHDNATNMWIEQEIPLDVSKKWIMVFINKARSGENSNMNEEALLLEFDGDHAVFYEKCWCHPKHASIE